MDTALPEKRKFKRVEAHFPVIYRNLIYVTKSSEKGSLSKDVGLGGIRLLDDFITESTKVLIEIYLKEGDIPIIAKGEVVWVQKIPFSDKYYIGIKFTEISEASLKRLTAIINSKLKSLAA